METSTILHSETCETSQKESDEIQAKKPKSETPQMAPFNIWPKKQFLFELDYAVREQIKRQLQGQLTREMDHFVAKGLTFDQLKEIQKELELCPSILEFYPGKRNFVVNWWLKFTRLFNNFFS